MRECRDSPASVHHHSIAKAETTRVGALATVNHACVIVERDPWNSSTPAFETLGVEDSFWKHDESQTGISAGQDTVLQHNRTKHYR
jgi:hypothetical protein